MEPALRISSITGVDVELRIAGPGARSYAFIVDWHIRFLLASAWFLLGTLAYTGGLRPPGSSGGAAAFIYVVSLPALAIYFFYHPVLEVVMRGLTPGKRYAGVRLVALADAGAPSTAALLIRNVFRLIDSFPVLYVTGLIATLVTRHNVRIGDIAAGTVLVYDEPQHRDALASVDRRAVGTLGLEHAQLARELLDRWQELGEHQRATLARQLLEKIGARAPTDDAELRGALEALLA